MADERSGSARSFRKRSFEGFAVVPDGRAFGVILAALLLGCQPGRDEADPVALRKRLGITNRPKLVFASGTDLRLSDPARNAEQMRLFPIGSQVDFG